MKKIITATFLFLLLPFITHAQWTARQSLGVNEKRIFATSFSINGNVYVVGGQANLTPLADVWLYDVIADSWTQKASFPGGARGGAVALTIGSKVYLISGSNYMYLYYNDVWEYDATADTWLQKSDFPGTGREEAFGFVIGNKGYFGTGYAELFGGNTPMATTFNDFWEYDPASDSWTPKADMPGQTRAWAIGVAVNGKGYAGLGSNSNQTPCFSDFYEYNPLTDVWTTKAGYGLSVADGMAFTQGTDIYVCGGINFGNSVASAALKKYTIATNSWSTQPAMPGGAGMGAVSVSVGNRAFIGTGYTSTFEERNDWWEFSSPTSTLCQSSIAFSATSFSTVGAGPCTGKIVVSNITNGCPPYTFSISPNTGTLTSGSGTSFTITSLCAGTYSVYITDANCCGTTMAVSTVTSSVAQGFSALSADNDHIAVFPNPNNGAFNVVINPAYVVNDDDLRIINSFGQQVPVTILRTATGIGVKLQWEEKGIYVMQISNQGSYISKKIQVD